MEEMNSSVLEESAIEANIIDSAVDKLNERIKKQFLEIADLHKKNTVIYKEIGRLEQELAREREIAASLAECKDQLEIEKNRASEAEKETAVLRECVRKLQDSLEDSTARCAELNRKLTQMENSKSWKITQPLRSILYRLLE